MFHIGRAGRGLWLPTQESIRMLWCGVLITKLCTQSTSLPVCGIEVSAGSSQARFSASSSFVSVGKNSSASKNGPCCSTTAWMVISLRATVVMGRVPGDADALI